MFDKTDSPNGTQILPLLPCNTFTALSSYHMVITGKIYVNTWLEWIGDIGGDKVILSKTFSGVG